MANKANSIKKALILIKDKKGEWVSGLFTSWVFDKDGELTLHLKDKDGEPLLVKAEDIDGAYLGIPEFVDEGEA